MHRSMRRRFGNLYVSIWKTLITAEIEWHRSRKEWAWSHRVTNTAGIFCRPKRHTNMILGVGLWILGIYLIRPFNGAIAQPLVNHGHEVCKGSWDEQLWKDSVNLLFPQHPVCTVTMGATATFWKSGKIYQWLLFYIGPQLHLKSNSEDLCQVVSAPENAGLAGIVVVWMWPFAVTF